MKTCLICSKEFNTTKQLRAHLSWTHKTSTKEYYDLYLKQDEEGVCPVCGNSTKFITITEGYQKYCCKKCANSSIEKKNKIKQTNIERYGVDSYLKTEEFKERSKQTNLEKYGAECPLSSQEIQEKKKKTCIERYGVDSYLKTEEFKERSQETRSNWTLEQKQQMQDKYVQTCLERYGVDNASKSEKVKRKGRQTRLERYGDENYNNENQRKITCLERYGVDNVFKLDEYQQKSRQTLKLHYGVDQPNKSPIIRNKIIQSIQNRYGVPNFLESEEFDTIRQHIKDKEILKNPNIIDIIYDNKIRNYVCNCPHKNNCPIHCINCNRTYIIPANYYQIRKHANIELCTHILPIQHHLNHNTSIEVFIQKVLNNIDILYKTNDRTILKGKELDIYIPDKKIAIECNGVYWHSFKDKDYHYNKWLKCNEQEIQLISIWEDWVVTKPQIVANMIKYYSGEFDNIIESKECTIKDISYKELLHFVKSHDIKPITKNCINIGVYYNQDIVSAITLKIIDNQIHIIQIYNNYTIFINNLLQDIIKWIQINYKYNKIIGHSYNDTPIDNLYKQNGFKCIRIENSSEFIITQQNKRIIKQKTKKYKGRLYKEFDSGSTVWELVL